MIITRTPLRISFFGGGTDLPAFYREHGGEVISTTIDKYLYITCRNMSPFWDYKHRLVYGSNTELVSELDEIDHPSIRETFRFFNIDHGIEMHYNTDIPARSGIGSSSSFTVGLLNALNGLEGRMKSKYELIEGQHPCGAGHNKGGRGLPGPGGSGIWGGVQPYCFQRFAKDIEKGI